MIPGRRLPRIGALVFAAAVVAAVVASSAFAALFFLFKPTFAQPGELVTLRLGGTPASFTLAQRKKPFQRPIRLYLVRDTLAGKVRSRFDQRLHFIGAIAPDKNSRGVLTFTVPPVDTGGYALAYWCPGCAQYSFGRTFGVQTVPEVSRYRDLMGLRVQMPPAATTCPVTIPSAHKPPPGLAASPRWHGNSFLWTGLSPTGVWTVAATSVAPDGSIFQKWLWFAAGVDGELTVRLERLDVPGPTLVAETVRGSAPRFRGTGTWAARMQFTSAGCWRVTGRVRDINLAYVVKVVAG